MDKQLGADFGSRLERMQFLHDNCDAIEEMGYTRYLSDEELSTLKERLVETNIQLRDVRADKKEANKEFNAQIKQLEETNDEVTGELKSRSRFVTEQCYKFVEITTDIAHRLVTSLPMGFTNSTTIRQWAYLA